MQNAEVRELVQRSLERYADDERTLDAYWQWASNPTPPSAGYALEENAGFIATNLMLRYGEPAVDLVLAVNEECRELAGRASIQELQRTIVTVLNGPVGERLRQGVIRRLSEPTPARRALAAWLVNRARWRRMPGREPVVAGEFDWSLGADLAESKADCQSRIFRLLYGEEVAQLDLAREAMAVGVVNRLFYRNAAGRMEAKLRPGPRLPASALIY
ncbi:hypothetical protein [Symbiobacterium terraclitae]|uniref:hypothetical protein n=1 Tax=Symbiobacterium terraclitae TaxID=557451 RepID=UPI0035B52118